MFIDKYKDFNIVKNYVNFLKIMKNLKSYIFKF